MFGADTEQADVEAFASRCDDDRHHFRFIVSPEDAAAMADLRGFARDLMRQAERDLSTNLDWVAVDHWNTDNPHLHILVRGKADDGRDLVISGDYIAKGMRARAQDLVSLELGPRTDQEIAAALDKEIGADRWTSLDRALSARRDVDGVVNLRPPARGDPEVARLIGRSAYLERLGLAETVGPGRWRLDPQVEPRLRDLGMRGDIIKTLHQAMTREGRAFDPSRLETHGEESSHPVLGRLVARGLRDELRGTAYAIVEGVDGRQHHLTYADLAETGDARPGAIVEATRYVAQNGRTIRALTVRSDLPLDAQIQAHGATWLDRQLVRTSKPEWRGGFGDQAVEAMASRLEVLVDRGLAQRNADGVTLASGLINKLRVRELQQATAALADETKLAARALVAGESVSGVYRRRLDLASGRFAMIDDGLGFQLAPWRPGLEARLGRQVVGVVSPDGGVEWRLGRARELGL